MTEMPRKLPIYVDRVKDRKGQYLYYFRRGKGPRTRLEGQPGTDRFLASYQAAMTGDVARPKTEAGPDKTLQKLIAAYYKSDRYHDLRETTRTGYTTRLNVLENEHGHRTITGMTREGIEEKILRPYRDRPGQRLAILKMLRVLINFAVDELKWIKADPSKGIRRPKTNEIRAWDEFEIAAFEKRWPLGTKQRTAFALHLYTGQRRSDVHRMTWRDIHEGRIRVVCQKTRAKLIIRLHQNLRSALEAADRKHVAILTTAYGQPFTVDGFSQFMRDAITEAGLPLDCQPHGLRKAAGRRLAEAGCSAHEIMAILGHKTLAEAERYTREANQVMLGDAAISRLEGAEREQPSPNTSGSFGEIAKTEGKSA